jgi:hypothetical protein
LLLLLLLLLVILMLLAGLELELPARDTSDDDIAGRVGFSLSCELGGWR